jgi:hypothetical protein
MAVAAWKAGEDITAARLAAITPIWASWTPTWTTTSGANTPSYGNATIDCTYCQTGDLVVCRFSVTFGSTTSFGGGGLSDNYTFSLPVTGAATDDAIGHLELQYSTSIRFYARARMNSTTVFMIETSAGRVDGAAATNTGVADAITPETWASGDSIKGTLSYRAA